MNSLNKKETIIELNLPINQMECGVLKQSNDSDLNFITQLIEPGKNSFESNPFETKKIIIKLENSNDINKNNNNVSYCMVKLNGDEYWQYTKIGKFNDFFTFEYIDQNSLIIKSFDGNNNSQEDNIDINEFNEFNNINECKEKIISTSFGTYKVISYQEMIYYESPSVLTFNLYIQQISSIKKEKGVLWMLLINNQSSGYSYDGIFNKYFEDAKR